MLVAVIVVVQVVELVAARRGRPPVPVPWRTVATPYADVRRRRHRLPAAAAVDAVPRQRRRPAVRPRPDRRLRRRADRAARPRPAPGHRHRRPRCWPAAGMVVGCIRRPRLDIPLAALTVLSAVAVSTHFRMVGRYYFQVAPWVLYFAAAAIVAAAAARAPAAEHRRLAPVVRRRAAGCSSSSSTSPCCPATSPTPATSTAPAASRSARPIRRSTPIFDAVEAHTAPTDVVAYFRARTMTLYTDRRTIQTTNIDRDPAARRLLRPAARLELLPARHRRRPRPRRWAWSRCGRTPAGSSGGCRNPPSSPD